MIKSQQVTMYNRNYGGFDYPSTSLRAGSSESTRNCERQYLIEKP